MFGKNRRKRKNQTQLLTCRSFLKTVLLRQKKKPIALHNMPSTLSRYEFHWAADSCVGDITGAVNLNKMSAGVLRQRSRSQPFLLVLNCPAQCFPRVRKRLRRGPAYFLLLFSLQCLGTEKERRREIEREPRLIISHLCFSLSSVSDSVQEDFLALRLSRFFFFCLILNTPCYILISAPHSFIHSFISKGA